MDATSNVVSLVVRAPYFYVSWNIYLGFEHLSGCSIHIQERVWCVCISQVPEVKAAPVTRKTLVITPHHEHFMNPRNR